MRVAYWILLAAATVQLTGGIIGLLQTASESARIRRRHWSDLCAGMAGTLIWSVRLLPAFPGDGAVSWAGVLGIVGALVLRFGDRLSFKSREAVS